MNVLRRSIEITDIKTLKNEVDGVKALSAITRRVPQGRDHIGQICIHLQRLDMELDEWLRRANYNASSSCVECVSEKSFLTTRKAHQRLSPSPQMNK